MMKIKDKIKFCSIPQKMKKRPPPRLKLLKFPPLNHNPTQKGLMEMMQKSEWSQRALIHLYLMMKWKKLIYKKSWNSWSFKINLSRYRSRCRVSQMRKYLLRRQKLKKKMWLMLVIKDHMRILKNYLKKYHQNKKIKKRRKFLKFLT